MFTHVTTSQSSAQYPCIGDNKTFCHNKFSIIPSHTIENFWCQTLRITVYERKGENERDKIIKKRSQLFTKATIKTQYFPHLGHFLSKEMLLRLYFHKLSLTFVFTLKNTHIHGQALVVNFTAANISSMPSHIEIQVVSV